MASINIDDLIYNIAETTAEALRDYDILNSIEAVRDETNSRIIEIIGA